MIQGSSLDLIDTIKKLKLDLSKRNINLFRELTIFDANKLNKLN